MNNCFLNLSHHQTVTSWIETTGNDSIRKGLAESRWREPLERCLKMVAFLRESWYNTTMIGVVAYYKE